MVNGLLNDQAIDTLAFGQGVITPYNIKNLQPHSLDLTLGKEFKVIDINPYSTARRFIKLNKENFTIGPHEFVLAHTEEVVNLPTGIVGMVQGKSTIGRNGLQIENAGLIDEGFVGQITLELYNMTAVPLNLKAGMPICQILFYKTEPAVLTSYKNQGHYNGQSGATEPRYFL